MNSRNTKLRCAGCGLIAYSRRVRWTRSQRERDLSVRHHGRHVQVVNVKIDLPTSAGLSLPSLEVSLSRGYWLTTPLWRQSQSMPTIVKGCVAEDSNGYDGDGNSRLVLLK